MPSNNHKIRAQRSLLSLGGLSVGVGVVGWRFYTLLLLVSGLLLAPQQASAKRTPAPVVQPIVYQGIRYVIPNKRGTLAYVEAWDTATGKKLWKKTIFRKRLIPLLEPDVQWVFIKRMWREGDRLILVDERKRTYALNLKTRKVQRLKQPPVGSQDETR